MQLFRCLILERRRFYWGAVFIVLFAAFTGAFMVDYLDEQELSLAAVDEVKQPPAGQISIAVNVKTRLLTVYNDGQVYKTYKVAVGKSETPTPVGEWNVVWKDYNWGTGFGTRWMGLNVPWGIYGIHGTNKPWSIGRFASHGCIRMRNRDVEQLFEWVPVGTPVAIEGREIRISRVLKYQTAGPDVVIVQKKLKEKGFFSGRTDGIFGSMTDQAVREFQQQNGLEPNGVVDKAVQFLLLEEAPS